MRILSSQLRSPGPLVTARVTDRMGYAPEQRAAAVPIVWPRHVGGRTQMVRIDPSRIPAGWSAIQAHVPSRLTTCNERTCRFFVTGWTEIVPPDGSDVTEKAGILDRDQAAQITGYYPGNTPPMVIHHPPGEQCGRVHRTASPGIPPLYMVDGRPVLWNEFEDALGGGVQRTQQLVREGRY